MNENYPQDIVIYCTHTYLFLQVLHISAQTAYMPVYADLFGVRCRGSQEAWPPERHMACHKADSPMSSMGWTWLRSGPLNKQKDQSRSYRLQIFAKVICVYIGSRKEGSFRVLYAYCFNQRYTQLLNFHHQNLSQLQWLLKV